MEVEKTLKPGAEGTGKYVRRFGDRLVCVRHRLDRAGGKRFTTVELILEERPCVPRGHRPNRAEADHICRVRVLAKEKALIAQVRAAGGRWERSSGTWLVDASAVERHCLWHRVVEVLPPTYGQTSRV